MRTRLIGVLFAVALIAGLATYLLHTQEQGRVSLHDELDRRAELTGRLIGSAFMASNTAGNARERFGGSPRSVVRGVERLTAGKGGGQSVVVLDARGRLLAGSQAESERHRSPVSRGRHAQAALAGRSALSDAFRDASGRWRIEIAVPFSARSGQRRVMLASAPAEIVHDFAGGFFASASAIPGSHGYLLDGNGRTLSAMASPDGGQNGPDGGLRAALERGSRGVDGDRTFVTAPVAASRWRVVLSVPTSRLYAPVDGAPGRAAWLLFAAFSAAICGLLAFGFMAARGARRLAAAQEREEAARLLAHERLHDALTGLPNRTLFNDRAQHALAGALRRPRSLAVIFMDVDRFKRINDSLGHEAGDAVLREVARRLASSVRPQDTVSRFGGDEFVLLCEGIEAGDPLQVVGRIQQCLKAPVLVGERRVPVTASIGVAVHGPGDPPATAGDLVRDADTAMYRAKHQGGARVELFDAALHQRAVERLDAEVALRRAIDEEEFAVFYQPIVTLPEGDLAGAEALVRWTRTQTGRPVPPDEFIPLAEETGLIADIGEWVLRAAIREVGDWARRGLIGDDFELSVNVSAIQLGDARFPDTVTDALAGWDLPASRLCLELTESAVVSDAAVAMLGHLEALGVRLALDDFGIGHSSLGRLARSMPISSLKLDRSFVAAIADPRDRSIVQAAVAMARSLKLSSVAEGVETPAQAAELAAMGFTYAQGYHFGRPVGGGEFMARVRQPARA